jgi:hypothetical protein
VRYVTEIYDLITPDLQTSASKEFKMGGMRRTKWPMFIEIIWRNTRNWSMG